MLLYMLELGDIALISSKIELVGDKSSGKSGTSGGKLDDLKPIAYLGEVG